MSNLNLFLFFLVSSVKGEFNCCNQIEILSSGLAANHQGNRLGRYDLYDVQHQKPIYKQQDKEEFLFYLVSKKKGLWMVGPEVGQFNGGLAHRGDNNCVQNVRPEQWKYTDGAAWHRDPQLNISCVDTVVECMYKDGWELVGSDLPISLGGGGLKTLTSAQCIEECQERENCNYWTFVKDDITNCFLKKTNGKLVQREGYLSGSIPAACASTNNRRTLTISEQSTTEHGLSIDHQNEKYNDNEINGKFKITSLKWNNKLNDKNSQNFRDLATSIEDNLMDMFQREEELNEILNFTVSVEKFKSGSVVCNFKVNYVLREAYVAIPFLIKPSNITNTLMNNFRFKKGILFQRFLIAAGSFNATSPVDHCASKGCSHKCNYDYDLEDYLCTCPKTLILNINQLTCVPKEDQNKTLENPTNIQDGQRETPTVDTDLEKVIDDGSELDIVENTEKDTKVDHEEDNEVDTVINVEDDNEVNVKVDATEDTTTLNHEVNTEKYFGVNAEDDNEVNMKVDTKVTPTSPIVLTLLPTDCFWSPWSVWSQCSASCGAGKRSRTRDVLMEQKNGGSCEGKARQSFNCLLEKCTGSDIEDIITQELDEDIIIQELDKNNVKPKLEVNRTNVNDDNNFPDDGVIIFGEKLPRESDEGSHMEGSESTTINIHKYDTTSPSESKHDETFRKEDDKLFTFDETYIFDPVETTTKYETKYKEDDDITISNIAHSDHDVINNHIKEDEETIMTEMPENVTYGNEATTSWLNIQTSNIDGDYLNPNDESSQSSKENNGSSDNNIKTEDVTTISVIPENVINSSEDSTGLSDDDNNDGNITDTTLNTESESNNTLLENRDDFDNNLKDNEETTTNAMPGDNIDDKKHYDDTKNINSNNDINDDNDSNTDNIIYEETTTNRMPITNNDFNNKDNDNIENSNNYGSDNKIQESKETTTNAIPEDNNDNFNNKNNDNKSITNNNDIYEDNDEDETNNDNTTYLPNVQMEEPLNSEKGKVDNTFSENVMNEGDKATEMDKPLEIGEENNDGTASTTSSILDQENENMKKENQTLQQFETTQPNNYGTVTTTSSILDPENENMKKENQTLQQFETTQPNNDDIDTTTNSILYQETQNMKKEYQTVQQSETTQLNNDGIATTTSSILGQKHENMKKENETIQQSKTIQPNNDGIATTSSSILDQEIENVKKENQTIQQSETTQPDNDGIATTASNILGQQNENMKKENQTLQQFETTQPTANDIIFYSTDLPSLNQITYNEENTKEAGVNVDNEITTLYINLDNTDTTEAIPILDILVVKDYPITTESSQDYLTTQEVNNLSTTTKPGFTTIIIHSKEITTTATYESATDEMVDEITEANKPNIQFDTSQTEQNETTTYNNDVTTSQDFKHEKDDITTHSTFGEQTTEIPNEENLIFKCSEMIRVDFNVSESELPMDCLLENGNEKENKKHVIIIINKNSFDTTRLFENNVKLVAKNIMLMDITKR